MSIPIYTCVLKKCGRLRIAESLRKILYASDAKAIAKAFLKDSPCERLLAIYLDNQMQVIGIEQVAQGGSCGMSMSPADIFRGAIACNSRAILLAHNHPSGDANPSSEDWTMTQNVVKGGKVLGIAVLDHLIVGNTVASMREQNDNDLVFG